MSESTPENVLLFAHTVVPLLPGVMTCVGMNVFTCQIGNSRVLNATSRFPGKTRFVGMSDPIAAQI
jgi:hypothetical protein